MRCFGLMGTALLLATASPLAAQQSDYDRAVAARLADDPSLAAALLEQWLANNPQDVDARLQYGYALLALGRIDEAERAFRAVLAAAPDYDDARDGLALVERRRSAPAETARSVSVVADFALSSLDAPQSDWSEAGLAVAVPIGAGDTLDVKGTWYERFNLQDVEIGGLYTHRAGEDVWVRFGASGTPAADFRPEIAATAGLDYRAASSTVLSFDIGWQDFPAEQVWSLRPGITQYLGGGRFALNASARAVVAGNDDLLIGGALRGDFLPRDNTRLFIGAATGPETDLGIVRDTTSLFGGGEVPLGNQISLLASVSHEWREVGSDRTEGRIGIKFGL